VWSEVVIVLPVLVLGTIVAVMMAHRLDLLALGERNARHLGVDVEQLRIIAIVLVALLTGVAVAFAGIIAFVGLVVPHIIRMALGPAHRGLLVASAVGGGALLAIADLLTRTLVAGADLPIGMLTALVGGPFFFALLYQQRRRSGGWA
jgi:iron complex transport system permease protein